ncbi:MAG: PAS domain-containing hybrid sensor histidine kinase/response regulator [Verrucomicrobiia bacterium]
MTSSNQLSQLTGESVLWVFQIDNKEEIKWTNSAVEDFLLFRSEEVKGKHLEEFVRNPEEIKKILNESFSKEAGFQTHYIPFLRKDGIEVWFESVIVPMIHKSGRVEVCVCFCKEMSEASRKRRRETIAIGDEDKKFMDALLSLIPTPIFYTDREARYIGCNRAFEEFFHLKQEQIYGKTVEQIFPGEKSREYYIKDLELIKNNARETKQVEIVDANKQTHQVLLTKAVYPDQRGETAGMIGILMDVTILKQDEENKLRALQEAQQAQRLESLALLAGGVAHDFNNMLTVILGNVDLALSDIPSEYAAVDYLREARATCLKAADLCRQMLLFTGRTPFNRQLVNLNSIIQDMNKLLQAAISRRIYIQYRFTQPLPFIEADPGQVKQVIMSLVVNASEAMGDKPGVITITTGWMRCDKSYLETTVPACRVGLDKPMKQGNYVFLEVSDSGCGMDADLQKRIFDPFFTTKFFGRGLGLAAVLGIMRSHSGGIKVYSEPGKGTTFKILFPTSENGKAISVRNGRKEKGRKPQLATLLIVDDEEGVRNFAKKCLEHFGYKVITAAEGSEAIELFSKHKEEIALVFLDFTMPGMPSEDVFREFRLMKPDVKVVLCSGYSEEQAMARFLGKGLAGFLQKPYGLVALSEKLNLLLPPEKRFSDQRDEKRDVLEDDGENN